MLRQKKVTKVMLSDPLVSALLGSARTEQSGLGTKKQRNQYQQGLAVASPCWYLEFGIGIWFSCIGYFGLPRPCWAEQRRRRRIRDRACLSRRRVCARPRRSRAAQVARSEAEGPRLRVAFLLGTFLWRSKEKCLARRGETGPTELREGRTAGARPGLLHALRARPPF